MSAEVQEKTKLSADKKYYLHSVIGLLIMFGFGYLPPFATITPLGMKFMGIFLGLLYLWSLVDMTWPSIAGVVALALTGAMSVGEIAMAGFGSNLVIMIAFSMAIVFALNEGGVFDYIIPWLLKQKLVKGKPWLLTILILFIVYILSALWAGLVSLFVLWPLILKLADAVEMPRTHPWVGATFTGIMWTSVVGSMAFPFMGTPMFVIGVFQSIAPIELPFISYTVFALAVYLMMLAFYILMMRFVMRIDVSLLKNIDVAAFAKELPPMSKEQKFLGGVMAAFILSMIAAGSVMLMPDCVIKTGLKTLGTTGICWVFFVFLAIYRVNGKAVLNARKVAGSIQWECIFLMVVAFTLAPKFTGEGTGIAPWILSMVNPILGGLNPTMFVIVFFIITIFLTNLLNNTVVIMLMVQIIAVYATQMTFNLPMMAVFMALFSQIAFLLPASSMMGAMLHAQAVDIGKKNIYIWASWCALAAVVALVVCMPLANILF